MSVVELKYHNINWLVNKNTIRVKTNTADVSLTSVVAYDISILYVSSDM